MGKRLYLSRTPLTRPYFALCSSNPKARADHAFQEQHRPKEYSVAVEFKPRANCGGFTWLGSAVFGVSVCITQAGQNSNFLTRNTFDVSTHVIIISLFGHLMAPFTIQPQFMPFRSFRRLNCLLADVLQTGFGAQDVSGL